MSCTSLKHNQSGMAAITVTLIILGIVTLITVGFATLMRREQRQALDQQLSTQAFYAAESAVNVTRDYIDNVPDPNTLTDVEDCDDMPDDIRAESNLGANASFTCVLMDVTPDELQSEFGPDKSWIVRVQTKNGQPIDNLEISWQTPGTTNFALPEWSNTHLLLPENKWKVNDEPVTGLLRMMLIPGTADRNQLITNTYHAFLYPNASNAAPTRVSVPATPGATDQGRFLNGNCTSGREPRSCTVRLENLNSNTYYLRLKAIYNPVSVSVRSFNDDNERQELRNGQAKIDATGKAADVVRRIQVNVPLATAGFTYPEYAVETFSTLCKRFIVWPGGAENDVQSSNGALPYTEAQRAACEP